MGIKILLFRAEQSITGITETGQNVTVLVELTIHGRYVDLDIGMCFSNCFDAFRYAYDAHKTNFFASAFFEEVYCAYSTAAGSKHGVEEDSNAIFDALGKFAVILVGFEGLFVTIKTDVSYSCIGEESVYTVYHSKTCAEDRYDSYCAVCNHCLLGELEGSLNHNLFGGNVFERFVYHEGGDFFDEFAEELHAGLFVAEYCYFMLDKGMIEYRYVGIFFHDFSFYGLSEPVRAPTRFVVLIIRRLLYRFC